MNASRGPSGASRVAPAVSRLTSGVANFYLIEESGKLTVVDAGHTRGLGPAPASTGCQR